MLLLRVIELVNCSLLCVHTYIILPAISSDDCDDDGDDDDDDEDDDDDDDQDEFLDTERL